MNISCETLLARAQRTYRRHFAERLDKVKLTARQVTLLREVKTNARSQVALVKATGIDRSTLAEMLHSLKGRGLVQAFTSGSDRRANLVRLTSKGIRLLAAAELRANEAEAAFLAPMTAANEATLRRLLQKCIDAGSAK